jgi:hypothetical protein
MTISTVSGSGGGWVGGISRKDRNNARCRARESRIGQPGVARRRAGTTIRFPPLSIDRTGPSGVSPQDAPLFGIDDLGGQAEPITIGQAGALQSPHRRAAF